MRLSIDTARALVVIYPVDLSHLGLEYLTSRRGSPWYTVQSRHRRSFNFRNRAYFFPRFVLFLFLLEEMPSGGNSSRFDDGDDNNDDLFDGGPCPSCGLAINQETGRLECVPHSVRVLCILLRASLPPFVLRSLNGTDLFSYVSLLFLFAKCSDGAQAETRRGAFVLN